MLRLINAQPITYYKLDSNVKVNEKRQFRFYDNSHFTQKIAVNKFFGKLRMV